MGRIRHTWSQLRRVVIAGAVASSGVVIAPMLAGVADAHHSEISGTVNCAGVISFTATSWTTGLSGEHPQVEVVLEAGTSTGADAPVLVGVGEFTEANGYSFSGTAQWPTNSEGNVAFNVFLTTRQPADVAWGDGALSIYGRTLQLIRPSDCGSDPAATVTAGCANSSGDADGNITVVLTNQVGSFGVATTFAVTHPVTGAVAEYVVVPGGSETVVFAPLTDGSYTVGITASGRDLSQTVTVDCDRPVVSVRSSAVCVSGDGTIDVVLTNSGGAAVTLLVTNPVSAVDTAYTLGAGESTTVSFTGLADGDYTVAIQRQGSGESFDQILQVRCNGASSASISYECVDGQGKVSDGAVRITLTNGDDDASATFAVSSGGTSTDYVVAAGASRVVTITGLSDARYVFLVSGAASAELVADIACDEVGSPTVGVQQVCRTADGVLVITLNNIGGELALTFRVQGSDVVVSPNAPRQITLENLADGPLSVEIFVIELERDLSIETTIACDRASTATFTAACADFDGALTFTLVNNSDDGSSTFSISVDGGTPTVVQVTLTQGSQTVTLGGLSDGSHSVAVTINGVAQPAVSTTTDCDPTVGVAAVCTEVDVDDVAVLYWYRLTNTETSPVSVAWNGGSQTLGAGATATVASTSSPLVLTFGGVQLSSTPAAPGVCTTSVTFVKQVTGQPPTGETYTIRLSRLVNTNETAGYEEVTTFDLLGGQSVTLNLPSSLAPGGAQYLVEEIDRGTASTSSITNDEFTLNNHLGETVSVVIVNNYASVQIDKTVNTTSAQAGGQLVYTLQATNTGPMTLDPVVISDLLPPQVSFASVAVESNAAVCSVSSGRPQLVTCTMDDALPAGGRTKVITIVVTVDAGVAAGTQILNQSKVLGTFENASSSTRSATTRAVDAALTCLPPVSGTVCDLSAQVGVPVVASGSGSNTTTTVSQGSGSSGLLPATGNSSSSTLAAAAVLLASGVLLLALRRRRPAVQL